MKYVLKSIAIGVVTALAINAATVPASETYSASQTEVVAVVEPLPEHLSILFVGDSISEGGPFDKYRGELSRLLTLAGVTHDFYVEAHGGWTCAMWLNWMQNSAAYFQPDVTIIACGTNDAANGWGKTTYRNNYNQLISQAKAGWPATKVLGTWIQYSAKRAPWYPWLLQQEAIHNDAVFEATINKPGVIFPPADMQGIPEIYLQDSTGPGDPGGLHPTAAGDIIMAHQFYRALAATYSLPLGIIPVTCGLMGGRLELLPPVYEPCNTPAEA